MKLRKKKEETLKKLNIEKGKKKRGVMRNITINIPEPYEKKIQELIGKKLLASRSEAIRLALRDFLHKEFEVTLDLLDYFEDENENTKNTD